MWGLLGRAQSVLGPLGTRATQFAKPALSAAQKNLDDFLRSQGLIGNRALGLSGRRLLSEGTRTQQALQTVKGVSAMPMTQATVGLTVGLPAADFALNQDPTGLTRSIETALGGVGPAVDRFFGSITPQVIQQYGREQEKKGWGGAFETASLLMGPPGLGNLVTPAVASLAAPFIPNTKPLPPKPTSFTNASAGTPFVKGGVLGYKGSDGNWYPRGDMDAGPETAPKPAPPDSLDLGSVAPQAPAFDPQAQMRERAVAQEKSRIEQLTRQNPDMQRYSSMRKTAAAPGATTAQIEAAEKLGEEIWRKKYGATALGKEGGVVGSYNPLMQELLGYQAGGAPMLIGPGQVVTPAPVTRLQ
jgi:hypothetical protein